MTDKVHSKNWPNTQWQSRQQVFVANLPKPNISLPKIKDLPISKELALSRPIKMPDFAHWGRTTDDAEQYAHLSSMLRTNIFPGSERAMSASSYSETFGNPNQKALYNRSSARDFRRKKQGFSKRLEHDLDFKRIEAAWKEYFETQKPIINWELRKQEGTSIYKPKKAKAPPVVQPPPRPKRKKPPPPVPPPPDPVIPSPDMGDMDIFKSSKTPDWAKDAESIAEEIEMDNKEFWEFFDDPF